MNKKDMVLEKFTEKIDKELSTRKKNLQDMKTLIDSSENLNDKFIMLRGFYPNLYAHYEGFLKSTFFNLIDSLESLELNSNNINPNLVLLCAIPDLEEHIVSQDKKATRLLDIFNDAFVENQNVFKSMNKDKYIINHDTVKSTFSLLDINIDSIKYPLEELGIIYNRRNGIAHGELEPKEFNIFNISKSKDITQSRINKILEFWNNDFKEVCTSLETIKTTFYNYLDEEKYLKENRSINYSETQTNELSETAVINN